MDAPGGSRLLRADGDDAAAVFPSVDQIAYVTGFPRFCTALSCVCGQWFEGDIRSINYPCATRGRVRAGISGIRQLTT